MPKFTSISALCRYVQHSIDSSLITDVADKVKEVEQSTIKSTVYDVYSPLFYQRRYENKGLLDINNITKSLLGSGTLSVSNITEANGANAPDRLDTIIEYGTGGTTPYAKARPFTRNTIQELEESKVVSEVLRKSLRKFGIRSI